MNNNSFFILQSHFYYSIYHLFFHKSFLKQYKLATPNKENHFFYLSKLLRNLFEVGRNDCFFGGGWGVDKFMLTQTLDR